MNGNPQFEVVMEYNIRARARVDHPVWAPCAHSTPLRKPLETLNTADVVRSSKRCNMSPKALYRSITVEAAEGKRRPETNKNVTKKKSNKKSRILHCFDDEYDDDDSEDEKTGSQTNKRLVLKLSSSQFSKRSLRRKRPVLETNLSSKDQGKDSKMCGPLKPTKITDSKVEIITGNGSSIFPHQTPNIKEFGSGTEVKETSKNLNTSDANTPPDNERNEKCHVKLIGIQETISSSMKNYEKNGIAPQKRKNESLKISHIKRLKTESTFPILSANKGTRRKAKLINNCKNDENLQRGMYVKKRGPTRLSVSHEIFSDSKEREFRDSLDLTAADNDELPAGDLNCIKLPAKQKALPKQKYASSRQTLNSETPKKIQVSDNSHKSRPKRLKRSPKEFWLPKSEKKDDFFLDRKIDAEMKGVNDDQSDSSIQNSDIPKGAATKVSISSEDGSKDLPSDTVYVKTISDLEFEENGSEDAGKKFSVAVGWQFSTFKCCALKIDAKCEASGRTKSSKSHFSGVLLKGRLSMRIGDTEVKMKDGQMFYVPPLTDWRAINIGRVSCVLYYWVGKL